MATSHVQVRQSGSMDVLDRWGNALRLPHFLTVWAVAGLLFLLISPLFFVPAEDATILHQYSDNWALTGQITYNQFGPRVEGATDFLWMALLAGMRTLHVAPLWATAVTNGLSVLVTAALLLMLARRPVTVVTLLPVAGLWMLVPQYGGALAGFSVLPFATLLASSAFFYQNQQDPCLAATLLLLCLFRPDGVVFALPLIAFRLFSGRAFWPKRATCYLLLFVVPGCIYFWWRWRYFGQFLPLPFLVKSDTRRVLGVALGTSNIDILKYLAFDLAFISFVLRKSVLQKRNLLLLLAFGIVPTLFYMSMRLDQDIADRFFIYLLLCPAVLVAVNWNRLTVTRGKLIGVGGVLWCLLLSFAWLSALTRFCSDGYRNNVVSIARELDGVTPHGTLALSEAGRIAYFSHWNTVDLWGLNTPEYAHRLFLPSDVAHISPDLLVLYYPESQDDCRYSSSWKVPHTQRNWPNLAQNVITGVHDTAQYRLWMVPSSGFFRRALHGFKPGAGEYQCWFVKQSFANAQAVGGILQRHGAIPGEQFFLIRFGNSKEGRITETSSGTESSVTLQEDDLQSIRNGAL